MAELTRHELNAHHSGLNSLNVLRYQRFLMKVLSLSMLRDNPLLWQKATAKFSQWTIVARTWAILLTVGVSTMAS